MLKKSKFNPNNIVPNIKSRNYKKDFKKGCFN